MGMEKYSNSHEVQSARLCLYQLPMVTTRDVQSDQLWLGWKNTSLGLVPISQTSINPYLILPTNSHFLSNFVCTYNAFHHCVYYYNTFSNIDIMYIYINFSYRKNTF